MKLLYNYIALFFLTSCGILNTSNPNFYIHSIKKDNCLQIMKDTGSENWEKYCGFIDNFEYQEGFEYQVEVKKLKKDKNTESKNNYLHVSTIYKSPALKEPGIYAYIETSMGGIVGKLAYDKAPLTVANFIGLAEGSIKNQAFPLGKHYFDSLSFHRVIPNFMIQGGDPIGNGTGGPGYKFKNEIHPDLKHDKPGVFSMANSGPNTNGSQFFITHVATPWLDGNYNVFGEVVIGQEIVNSIGNVATGKNNKPLETIYMSKVEIIRIGQEALDFDAKKTFKYMNY